jgi:hypothetical protein
LIFSIGLVQQVDLSNDDQRFALGIDLIHRDFANELQGCGLVALAFKLRR